MRIVAKTFGVQQWFDWAWWDWARWGCRTWPSSTPIPRRRWRPHATHDRDAPLPPGGDVGAGLGCDLAARGDRIRGRQPAIKSIVFGASSRANIRQTKALIDRADPRQRRPCSRMSDGGTIGQARQVRPAGYRQEIVGFRGCVFGMVARIFGFPSNMSRTCFGSSMGRRFWPGCRAMLDSRLSREAGGRSAPVAAGGPAFRTGRIAEAASPLARSSASIWTTEIETMCCDLDGQGKPAVIRVGMQFHRFRAS